MHSAARHAHRTSDIHAVGASEPHGVESIGRQLCEALPPLRLHSVSIYDSQCNVLWLSEGALGPDEHALVVDALERFAAEPGAGEREQRVEDGRAAVFLPIGAPQGALAGLVMVLADAKFAGDSLLERIMTREVREHVQALASVVQPAAPGRLDHDPTSLVLSLADDDAPADSRPSPDRPAHRELAPAAVDQILQTGELSLEFEPRAEPAAEVPVPARGPEPAPQLPPVLQPPAASDAAAPAAQSAPAVLLEVLPFVKLRSGGRMRWFEVLPRGTPRQNRDPAALDVLAVQGLLGWLAEHRDAWTAEPTTFTLNLSIATLEDDRFLRQLSSGLGRSAISPDALGFEIAEPLCTQRRAQVERFISGCERLGCSVVIDGFSFDSAVIPLLRSKAVRLVKMDPRLTVAALKDKLSQALVVAIVQAVKVLGIHCAAQQIDSTHVLRWLTAAGCDLGQGSVLARRVPIEHLQAPAPA
jgi:EAL domain-containing protein (putative c-di-GMP-specific phosphodiesterase class I)